MASSAVAPRNLSFAEARATVLGAVRPLPSERARLAECRGRALAADLPAPHPLPPFRNSSMDGYAVRASDLAGADPAHPIVLPVSEVVPAGRGAEIAIAAGEVARIMTGAPLPAGADAIVPFEDAERSTQAGREAARFARRASPGDHLREAGRDLAAGAVALPAGRELSAWDLALLAALGVAEVPVVRRARVAILSTGDELLDVDAPLRPGAIRDSNLPMLRLLLEEAGCSVVVSGRVSDDRVAVTRRIRGALAVADVVLTIGGVSAGDFDPVKLSLEDIGGVELWRVAMKPGRPQAFGAPEGRIFFGLPGNPASVACVFEALVRPALRRMQGFTAIDRPRLDVTVAETMESRAGRTDFVRATLEGRDGAWLARAAGDQVSGHLTPQSRAHALVIVPDSAAALHPGDVAEAILLRHPEPASH